MRCVCTWFAPLPCLLPFQAFHVLYTLLIHAAPACRIIMSAASAPASLSPPEDDDNQPIAPAPNLPPCIPSRPQLALTSNFQRAAPPHGSRARGVGRINIIRGQRACDASPSMFSREPEIPALSPDVPITDLHLPHLDASDSP